LDVLGGLYRSLIKWLELVEENEEEERIHRGRDKYLSNTGGQKKIDGLQKIDDRSDEGLRANNPAFEHVLPMVSKCLRQETWSRLEPIRGVGEIISCRVSHMSSTVVDTMALEQAARPPHKPHSDGRWPIVLASCSPMP
jgi:hypothetical protein